MRPLFSFPSALAVLLFLPSACDLTAADTALDRYVRAADPAYEYELVSTDKSEAGTTFFLKFTSQTWLAESEVNPSTWWHWLVIHRPEKITTDIALLFITGGSNQDREIPRADEAMKRIAEATGSVVAQLRQVPNQPLVFHHDGRERYEDDLIAYGWDRFLRGGRDEWLARFPMTKSAARAMDTVTAFLATPGGGSIALEKFVVSGASKRGWTTWTTWTTAATDRRVVAIAPIVIDMLNVAPSFRHHWEAYGFYAPAVGDYVRHGVMDWQGTPEYARLTRLVEPYEYRDRLTLPKLMINATGDQFFLPDSHRFYFDQLQGPKYLRYVPNADHSLKDSDAVETLAAWHHVIAHQQPLPRFDWEVAWDAGEIMVRMPDAPAKILLWQATNPDARDFRLETIGRAWSSSELRKDEDGRVVATVERPARGWTAFMVELTYPVADCPTPLKLTTGVAVVPDVLPFAGRFPEANTARSE